jgi:acetolactate synthase-1/2/3 large subunit/sulfoacetaldehyde acetyltransferase
MVSGIAQAYVESSPVIALLGDISTLHHGRGSSNFHEVDQEAVFRPITKVSRRVERADRLGEWLHTAFRVATAGRRGPVALHLPRDILRAQVVAEVPAPLDHRPVAAPRGDPSQIETAAGLLAQAERPVLLVGGGVRWSPGAPEAALALAGRSGLAAVVSHKGLLPEDHPNSFGLVGMTSNPIAMQAINQADVVLAVACTLSQVTTASYGHKVIPAGAKIIHVDLDPTEMGKSYPLAAGIVGDARAVLENLLDTTFREAQKTAPEDIPAARRQWLDELVAARADWAADVAAQATSDQVPIHRLRLLADVRKVLDRDATLSAEAGSTHQWFRYGFRATTPMLEPGDYSIMGSAYCMALAAKLAHPDRQVVSFIGDGAFMMVGLELATAVTQKIPVVAIVCHNDIYGNVRRKQITHFESRFIGSDLHIPDLAEFAHAFGAYGERVEQPGDIIPALERALASGQPAVLDVMVDRSPEMLEPPTKLRVADRY